MCDCRKVLLVFLCLAQRVVLEWEELPDVDWEVAVVVWEALTKD